MSAPLAALQVSVENLSNIEKRLSITVACEEIKGEVEKQLAKSQSKAKIKGFRQGKVPASMIKKLYFIPVFQDVIGEKIKESYIAAIEQETLSPAGMPTINVTSPLDANVDLTYTATVEVYPQINLVDFNQLLEVEKIKAEVTDRDIEENLVKLAKQHAVWNKVVDKNYAIKTGDKVQVDFSAKVHCEPPKEEHEKDVKFTIGSGEMWQEFESNILGKNLDSEVTFSLVFPESHIDKDVIGKTADFTVKINEILVAEIPEITEEFAKKCGVKEGGVDALRPHIKEHLEKELTSTLRTVFRNNIVNKVIAVQPLDIPKVLVEEEIKRRQEQMHQQLKAWLKMKDIPMPERERFEEIAKNSVAIGLIFTEIGKTTNLNVSEEKVKAKVLEHAKNYHDPEALVNWYYSDPKHLASINAEVFEDEIFAYLEQKAKINEKQLGYQEAMAQKQQHQH